MQRCVRRAWLVTVVRSLVGRRRRSPVAGAAAGVPRRRRPGHRRRHRHRPRGRSSPTSTRDDFEVIEDGRPQTVTYFAARRRAETGAARLHLGPAARHQRQHGRRHRAGAHGRRSSSSTRCTDAVDITLVDFDTEVRVARYGQRDFPRLVERIRARKPDGCTALYDALGVYLDGAADAGRPQDPGALHRRRRHAQRARASATLMTLLRASDVTVYAVGFLEHQPAAVRSRAAAAAAADRRGDRRRRRSSRGR